MSEAPDSNLHPTALSPTEAIIDRDLLAPMAEFAARPSKQFRAILTGIGFDCGARGTDLSVPLIHLETLKSAVEHIHLGSLIIDDFQDQSAERRGRPALHTLVGDANAINIGSFAYFHALERLSDSGMDAERERAILKLLLKKMTEAHRGQAIDMNAQLFERSAVEIISICRAARAFKTGSICSMAFGAGYALSAGSAPAGTVLNLISELGCVLQIHDDLGNLRQDFAGKKCFEDLNNCRPSWAWETAASMALQGDSTLLDSLKSFTATARLDARDSSLSWSSWPLLSEMHRTGLKLAAVVEEMWIKNLELSSDIDAETKNQLHLLYLKVRGSYGQKSSSQRNSSDLKISP